ncbi:MAG: hypothetical protein EP320_01720 [Rhodobacteraceae bacterium]|nr:MAG: hypothetical protein EP320_01720 [Paracoccaceae bacterium]
MSMQSPFEMLDVTTATNAHPIALRFKEMFPYQLHRYDLHLQRKQREMDHVDHERTPLNRQLHGEDDWLESLKADIELARLQNLNQEVEGLQRTRGSNEAQKRLIEGPRDPWRDSKGGPLREFIITANKEWFEETSDSAKLFDIREQAARERQFEARALKWLKSRFGDMLVHARADRDETTFHIHGIIAPWHEKHSKRSGCQRLLQPSSHPLLKDYEKAQDDIGAFFAELGLVRGERRAEARRKAKEARKTDPSVEIPKKRKHIPAHIWRADEELRLVSEARKLKADRKSAQAERDEAARLKREADRKAQEARAASEQARERTQAADEVLQIAEQAENGNLRPGEKGRLAIRRDDQVAPETRKGLERVLANPTPAARKLIRHLEQAYSAFRQTATRRAETEVETRMHAVMRAETALHALRNKIVGALPEALKKRFVAETTKPGAELERAMRAVRRGDQGSEKDDER